MTDEDNGGPEETQSLWRRVGRWAGRATTALAALSALWFIWVLSYETFRKHGIELEAIAVPKELIDNGFTSDVVTRRLRDAIKAIEDRAQTKMRKENVEVKQEVDQEMPEITIHEAGVPVAGMSRSIRRWLPEGWRHEVSGEFVRSGSTISLRLRLNGRIIFPEQEMDPDASITPTDERAIDSLIHSAALRVVEADEPSLAAIYYYYQGEYPAAAKLATRIIFERPRDDENVARSYNLKGIIAENSQEYRKAEEFFSRSQNLSVSLFNLGFVHYIRGFYDKALDKFGDAILFDNELAQAHYAIGSVWDDLRKQKKLRNQNGSAGNLPEAFWLEPAFGFASVDVENIYQGTLDDIIVEYRLATWLDPMFPTPHEKLGDIFIKQENWTEAAEEIRESIRIDRVKYEFDEYYGADLVRLYVKLAGVLRAAGRPAEAIDSLNEAIRLDPKEPNLRYLMGVQLEEFGASAEGEPERSHNLRSACVAVMEAAVRIGTEKGDNSLMGKIDAGIAAIDAALKGSSRCPPQSGATIKLNWEKS